jgi:hypothetical protein
MQYLHQSIHFHAGGRIQSGCAKDKLNKYADYQEMVIAGEYSDEGKSDLCGRWNSRNGGNIS